MKINILMKGIESNRLLVGYKMHLMTMISSNTNSVANTPHFLHK